MIKSLASIFLVCSYVASPINYRTTNNVDTYIYEVDSISNYDYCFIYNSNVGNDFVDIFNANYVDFTPYGKCIVYCSTSNILTNNNGLVKFIDEIDFISYELDVIYVDTSNGNEYVFNSCYIFVNNFEFSVFDYNGDVVSFITSFDIDVSDLNDYPSFYTTDYAYNNDLLEPLLDSSTYVLSSDFNNINNLYQSMSNDYDSLYQSYDNLNRDFSLLQSELYDTNQLVNYYYNETVRLQNLVDYENNVVSVLNVFDAFFMTELFPGFKVYYMLLIAIGCMFLRIIIKAVS